MKKKLRLDLAWAGKKHVFTVIVVVALHAIAGASEPDVVPLIFINDLPFIKVTIGETPTRLLIDTGGALGISIAERTVAKTRAVTLLD